MLRIILAFLEGKKEAPNTEIRGDIYKLIGRNP
jgi:hypothetical protein